MIKDDIKMDQLHPDSYRDGKDIRVKLQTSHSLNWHFRADEENLRLEGKINIRVSSPYKY